MPLLLGERPVVVGTLGILAAFQPPRAGRADLVLRLEINALRVVAAVVDHALRSRAIASRSLTCVAQFSRHALQQRGRVPVAHLRTEPIRSRPRAW